MQATKISGNHRPGLPAVAPRVHEALNLSLCAALGYAATLAAAKSQTLWLKAKDDVGEKDYTIQVHFLIRYDRN